MTKWVRFFLIANVVIFFAQSTMAGFTERFALIPALALSRPWTVVTYMFLHGDIMHIGFNMLGLWIAGTRVESRLGGDRFVILYFLSGLTAALFAFLFAYNAAVIGASGAIFGLFGALFVLGRRLRFDIRPIGVIIIANLVLTFTLSNISWQGHVGGLVSGAALAAVWAYAPRKLRTPAQIGSSILLAVLIVAIVVARTHALTS